MSKITAVSGRLTYTSRGSQTIEVDVTTDNIHTGRVSAPSGASVGTHEAVSFPHGGPTESLRILNDNRNKIVGTDASDLARVHHVIKEIDPTPGYSKMGGSLAFALSIAAAESAARVEGSHLFEFLRTQSPLVQSSAASQTRQRYRFPFPIGNVLGGGAHAGPGTPDIQEILICATGATNIVDAIQTNVDVHTELRRVLQAIDPHSPGGKGDEGGWAPKIGNEEALEAVTKACENLGFTLGNEVSLGVDFASSTQWNAKESRYVYDRAGFENDAGEQLEFVSDIIKKYKLVYVEDAMHEESFDEMAQLTARFPDRLIVGDDITVTNTEILDRAVRSRSCNAAILKVNQAGGLYDALEFAASASNNGIKLITSHRSGESVDSHISHIGIATDSIMLKAGVVGGERVAKINELLRIASPHESTAAESSEHDLIQGMAELWNS